MLSAATSFRHPTRRPNELWQTDFTYLQVVEGKPQCHIVAMAKEQQTVAASVGCALSRSRTGMRAEEMTCVIPGARLAEVVETLEVTVGLDRAMASYASADAKRFG